MTDPWLSAQQRNDATWVELDAALTAVLEAAVAEVLAKLWRTVLGERVAVTAAAQPPSLDGAEQAARETWQQALTRWVRPIVFAFYARQYAEAASEDAEPPTVARDAWWAATVDRIGETAERLVQAVRDTIAGQPTESIDQLRDRVAGTLGLDAPSASIREQIADTEAKLASLGRLTGAQQAEAYARRVRLQAELFRIEASRARSQAYQALAQALPDDADQFRDLARQSARSPGDLERVRRELASVDEQLFTGKRNADQQTADEISVLKRKRQHLYGQVDEADETWRNTAQRIARTESTNVLNEATLQRGFAMEAEQGIPMVKVWVSARDTRVRPSHAPGTGVHGQVRPLREPFNVCAQVPGEEPCDGARMMRPGDESGPLDEVIQCRCSITVLTEAEHEEIAAVLAAATPQEETVTVTAVEPIGGTDLEDLPPVKWFGVITSEGIYTGDRRKFSAGAIRMQKLPMPLRWARSDVGGHDGAVVVGNIEGVRRYQGQIRAWGTFADGSLTPEVDEIQGLMATQMMRGISIDGDDILDSQFAVEIDADGNLFEVYTSARLRSSTLVAIPAYDEAEVFLGDPPEAWLLEGEEVLVQQNDPETVEVSLEDLDALVADVSRVPEQLAEYWTAGEGAVKLGPMEGWFGRCRSQLSNYVSPSQLSGTCANLFHRRWGKWPGQESAGATLTAATLVDPSTLTVADFEPWEGHENGPGPGGVTPVTITEDGHVYGTIAPWKACHTGYSDVCVPPPKSNTNYGYFHTGGVRLADGSVLAVGKLTSTAGHANRHAGARAAMAHYDDTTTGAAIVRAFENRVGVQMRGVILSTATEEQIADLLASPLSGDWRPVREGMEMIAAHCVNNPGFAVMREELTLAASANIDWDVPRMWAEVGMVEGRQTSLVAGCAPYVVAKVDEIASKLPPLTKAEIRARVELQSARITPSEVEA